MPYKDPEQKKAKDREYSKKNKKQHRKNSLAYYYRDKDRHKNSKLKYVYGISLEEYNAMLTKQNGVCAICCKPETVICRGSEPKSLAVDHDHDTGKVRGLLCDMCNRGIGMLEHSPALLIAAARYLTEHKEKEDAGSEVR